MAFQVLEPVLRDGTIRPRYYDLDEDFLGLLLIPLWVLGLMSMGLGGDMAFRMDFGNLHFTDTGLGVFFFLLAQETNF